jgi:hypothetical protein
MPLPRPDTPGVGTENLIVPTPDRHRRTPIMGRRIYMPSTVELTKTNSTERIQGTHGRRDSNPQPSDLEAGALYR